MLCALLGGVSRSRSSKGASSSSSSSSSSDLTSTASMYAAPTPVLDEAAVATLEPPPPPPRAVEAADSRGISSSPAGSGVSRRCGAGVGASADALAADRRPLLLALLLWLLPPLLSARLLLLLLLSPEAAVPAEELSPLEPSRPQLPNIFCLKQKGKKSGRSGNFSPLKKDRHTKAMCTASCSPSPAGRAPPGAGWSCQAAS